MIIDFHTHIFPDSIVAKTIPFLEKRSGITAATNGTLDGLLHSMEQSGVDLSVIMPVVTKPAQFESVNAFAKTVNETYPGKVLSFGGIHPDCEDYKGKLRDIKTQGLPGIKLHPDYQGVFIDDLRFMRIIDYANELGLMILTHAGIDIGLPKPVHCPPDRLRKVIDAIHPERLIAAHLGGWKQWEMVEEYLVGQNVYFDTAFCFDYISNEQFMSLWEKHDHDKFLFATDSPWGGAAKNIAQMKEFPLTKEEKEAVFAGNAKKLLQLT